MNHRSQFHKWARASALLAFLVLGCHTTIVRREVDAFYLKHPSAKAEFVTLYAIPVEHLAGEALAEYTSLVSRLKELYEHGETNYLQTLRGKDSALELARSFYDERMKPIREIKSAAEKVGGEVHIYEIRRPSGDGVHDYQFEDGYAVLRNGEMLQKVVIREGHGSTNAPASLFHD